MGDDFDPEAYRRAMRINLDGVVYGIAAARPAIIASGGGTIVATASMAGLVPAPFDPIYAANKHAVVGLVRSIGDSYAAEGVRVHALCPSFAYTNIIKGSEQTLLDMGFPDHRRQRCRRCLPAAAQFRDVGGLLVRRGGTGERAVPLPQRPGPPTRLNSPDRPPDRAPDHWPLPRPGWTPPNRYAWE